MAVDTAAALAVSLGAKLPLVETLFVGEKAQAPKIVAPVGLEEVLKSSVRSGDAAKEIVSAANEHRADLVIMSTAGRHGFLDALRGSTTEQVLRRVRCPVLAVPA